MFSQVYENSKSNRGVPNNVRLYAVVVCPDAVALDVSAEVDITWRRPFLSKFKNPVLGSGRWERTPLPEHQKECEDYETWASEEYKKKASNDCVTRLVCSLLYVMALTYT